MTETAAAADGSADREAAGAAGPALRVLVVLYYWPPSGGPGVQRGVKLCRDLRAHGIEPTVVTVDPATFALPGEYDPDPSLAADVPADLRVLRTVAGARGGMRAALAGARLHRLAHHARPAAFFERQAPWLAPLRLALLRAVDALRPDALVTSSQPYSAHLAGRAAALATGIPWIADFRDPWTFSWGRSWPSRRALRWEERREEEVLADADVVVANTPGSRREWLGRHAWLDPRKVVVARNGYDPADFGAAAPRTGSAGEPLRIVHAGSFRARAPGAARTGLRARLDRVVEGPIPYDLSTHSPATLFAALRDADAPPARVRLVGRVDPLWLGAARALGLGDRVEATGYLPHRETVAELLAADALWLPTITRTDGGPVANVPAKTYEYLGSGRPVIAAAGPGDVADTVGGRARCRVVGPRDAEGVADALRAIADGRVAATGPDPGDARRYRRSRTAAAFASAVRLAVAGRRTSGAGAPPLDPARRAPETPSSP